MNTQVTPFVSQREMSVSLVKAIVSESRAYCIPYENNDVTLYNSLYSQNIYYWGTMRGRLVSERSMIRGPDGGG